MKKFLLSTLLVAASSTAFAQLDFELVIAESDSTALSGGSSPEFDGVAVTPDGRYVFTLDSESGFDAIIRTDTTLPDTDANKFIVYASEADVATATGEGGGSSATDMTVASDGTLYAIVRTGGPQNLLRIPSPGNIEVMISNTETAGANAIVLDETNNLLYIGFSSSFGSGSPDDVRSIPADASASDVPAPTLTQVATQTDIYSVMTPNSGADPQISDLALLSDGTLLFANGFGGDNVGDIVAIDSSNGSTSLFLDDSDLTTAMTNAGITTPALFSPFLTVTNDDVVLISSSSFSSEAAIIGASSDGAIVEVLIQGSEFEADPDTNVGANIIPELRGLAVDSSDNIYWASQEFDSPGVWKATGVDYSAFGVTTSVENWDLY